MTVFLARDTWLGRLLVARSEKGVCWVSRGEDDEELEGELRAGFPDAFMDPGDEQLVGWGGAIVAHLNGELKELEVPVDVGGSLFQRRVWWALKAIPYGRTRSYGEVARSLGAEVAPRAVARACAANVLAVVVPCHRAVGQDGDLTGFRWGLGRKRLLLERERQVLGEPTQMTLL
ncbi:MAG TPA: methylated-DNA--[protein]-cysteine S-methyltransferase [Chloroflexota bacterium]|nr:methylated-DNA--[protein]-cysteine S-methyltransferase [Chloroflexota bacterium]